MFGKSTFLTGPAARAAMLLALRVTIAGLFFWWGLARALDTGVGQAVSEGFYGGALSARTLLVAWGWLQAAIGVALALGLLRVPLLLVVLAANLASAIVTFQFIIDPFWLYLPGEKPIAFGHLFYPSAINVAVPFVLLAFRHDDRWALDAALGSGSAERTPG